MYSFKKKRKRVQLDRAAELEVMKNLADSYALMSKGFDEIKVIEEKASEERLSIIEELQQLNASLEALSNKAD